MTENHKLFATISKNYIEDALKKISEIERKRYSLPAPDLTDIEFDTLVGIAQGRNNEELDRAIKLLNRGDSYHSVVKRLLRKFEAFTLSHVVYKAVRAGIINNDL